MRKILDTATKRRGSWREVDVGRLESGSRRGETSEEEHMESENAVVKRARGGVLIYTSLMVGVHFVTVIPGGVYRKGKERKVGCVSTTTSQTEVDTGIVGEMH